MYKHKQEIHRKRAAGHWLMGDSWGLLSFGWKITWLEEPGGQHPMGSQRAGHDWATNTHTISMIRFAVTDTLKATGVEDLADDHRGAKAQQCGFPPLATKLGKSAGKNSLPRHSGSLFLSWDLGPALSDVHFEEPFGLDLEDRSHV